MAGRSGSDSWPRMNLRRIYSDSRMESPWSSAHQKPLGSRLARRQSVASWRVLSTLSGGRRLLDPVAIDDVMVAVLAGRGSLAGELAKVVTAVLALGFWLRLEHAEVPRLSQLLRERGYQIGGWRARFTPDWSGWQNRLKAELRTRRGGMTGGSWIYCYASVFR